MSRTSFKKSYRLPTTDDTTIQWMDDFSPEPGDTVGFSSQPDIGRQGKVLRRVCSEEWDDGVGDYVIEAVGPAVELDTFNVELAFDSLARTKWEDSQLSAKSKKG